MNRICPFCKQFCLFVSEMWSHIYADLLLFFLFLLSKCLKDCGAFCSVLVFSSGHATCFNLQKINAEKLYDYFFLLFNGVFFCYC